MKLKVSTLSRLTNFMLGVAWALALLGALSAFTSFLKVNLFVALLFSFVGAIPGLLVVLFLEYLVLKTETLAEMKKQTALLKQMMAKGGEQ